MGDADSLRQFFRGHLEKMQNVTLGHGLPVRGEQSLKEIEIALTLGQVRLMLIHLATLLLPSKYPNLPSVQFLHAAVVSIRLPSPGLLLI